MRAATILGMSVVLLGGCAKKPLDQVIQSQGYTSLVPPSNLLAPGTIVFEKSRDPLQVGILCASSSAIGGSEITVESPTTELSQVLSKRKQFSLGAGYLSALRAKGEFERIRDVKLTIRNPKLIELPRDRALQAVGQNRTEFCAQAVQTYADQGQAISMIVAVLQADVVYEVVLEEQSSLDVGAKVEMLDHLAAELQLASHRVEGTTIMGEGLFFGAIDEAPLAFHGMPGGRGLVVEALPEAANAAVVAGVEVAAELKAEAEAEAEAEATDDPPESVDEE